MKTPTLQVKRTGEELPFLRIDFVKSIAEIQTPD